MQRAAALRRRGFGLAREQVIEHRHHHGHKDHGVVDEMQLEPRNHELRDARGRGSAKQVLAGNGLKLQQRVLDVMPELDHERGEPPRARPAREAR